MRKIAVISAVPYGSTGRIAGQIAEYCQQQGDASYLFFSWSKSGHRSNCKNAFMGSFFDKAFHIVAARLTGLGGLFSVFDTYQMIRKLKKIKPDLINLHIIHAWSFNIMMLFDYIERENIPVVWTMHDCWAITGHCAHFTIAKCERWKTGCHSCMQLNGYPYSKIDTTKFIWKVKKDTFTKVKNMTVVTPSQWAAKIMQQSFMNKYPIKVIYNGLNLDIFKPVQSEFRRKYDLVDRHIVLGVAFDWGYKKGLDVFVNLAHNLPESYKIVLVGLSDQQIKQLPESILGITKTENVQELAEIYSSADVFVNATREEMLGMVNIEALACGTPVITFNTGGSPECVNDACGIVVPCDNEEQLKDAIEYVCTSKVFSAEKCIACAEKFAAQAKHKEYYELFVRMIE